MKAKKLNRIEVINFIKEITGIKQSHQTQFTGKNIYLIGDNENEPDFQLEFISQSKNYFFTILFRGLKTEADNLHDDFLKYLKGLELNRNIILDTETKISHI